MNLQLLLNPQSNNEPKESVNVFFSHSHSDGKTIQQWMSKNEISDIVSTRIIEVVKEQFQGASKDFIAAE